MSVQNACLIVKILTPPIGPFFIKRGGVYDKLLKWVFVDLGCVMLLLLILSPMGTNTIGDITCLPKNKTISSDICIVETCNYRWCNEEMSVGAFLFSLWCIFSMLCYTYKGISFYRKPEEKVVIEFEEYTQL